MLDILIGILVLYIWHVYNLTSPAHKHIKSLPISGVWDILTFSLSNALAEEIIFRLVLITVLRKQFSFHTSNIIQALVFGLFHYNRGFPSGILGLIMTSIFGWHVGQKPLSLAIIIHWIMDIVILSLVQK